MNSAGPTMKTKDRQKHQINDTGMIFMSSVAARTEILDATNTYVAKKKLLRAVGLWN